MPPLEHGDAKDERYDELLGASNKLLEEDSTSADEPPYSLRNEIKYFFGKGLPLGAASLLDWGIPPLMTMFWSGHVRDSADLQSALGYSRVFW